MITLDTIDSACHSIKIQDSNGDELAIDASGFITANINGTVTVTATDLDIRDLDSSQDSVEIATAAGQALSIDGSGFLTVNVNGSVTVTATDFDIRDLDHTQDNVAISQGGNTLTVESDGSINVNSAEDAYDTWQTSTLTATNTAGEIAASPLANRLRMIIQNLGSQDVFLGEDNTVTTSSGIKLPKCSSMDVKLGAGSDLWAITASGSADLRIAEFRA